MLSAMGGKTGMAGTLECAVAHHLQFPQHLKSQPAGGNSSLLLTGLCFLR